MQQWWQDLNNIYWIKNPTDKAGLLGNWKKTFANNIYFETKEMSSYAFAYYYMNYHDHRNMDQFVDRYVAWNNEWYKTNLKANYDWIYNEYEKKESKEDSLFLIFREKDSGFMVLFSKPYNYIYKAKKHKFNILSYIESRIKV